MRVSLITVARNAERTIAATLASALSQKGVDLEYVVVDGASLAVQGESYTSDNTERLDVDATVEKILEADYVRQALGLDA